MKAGIGNVIGVLKTFKVFCMKLSSSPLSSLSDIRIEREDRFTFRAVLHTGVSFTTVVLVFKDVNAKGEQRTFDFANPYSRGIDPVRYPSHSEKNIADDNANSAMEQKSPGCIEVFMTIVFYIFNVNLKINFFDQLSSSQHGEKK